MSVEKGPKHPLEQASDLLTRIHGKLRENQVPDDLENRPVPAWLHIVTSEANKNTNELIQRANLEAEQSVEEELRRIREDLSQ